MSDCFVSYLYEVSCSVAKVRSNSLQPHELQNARLPCPSLSPGSLLKLMSIESVMPCTPFSSCPQSFPATGPFEVSWLFTSGGQSFGASDLPVNIQG